MRNLSKWVLSLCLTLAIVVSMLSVSAFAAGDTQKNGTEAALSKLLQSSLYVEKNKKAGLRGQVNVALDLSRGGGVIYLPGSAKTGKLRLSWDTKGVTFSRNGKTYKSGKAPIAKAGKTYKYTVSKGGLSAVL